MALQLSFGVALTNAGAMGIDACCVANWVFSCCVDRGICFFGHKDGDGSDSGSNSRVNFFHPLGNAGLPRLLVVHT